MITSTPIQKDGMPVECPLCHEKKLSLSKDIEAQINFDLKKIPEIFFCYMYFCNGCGGIFFTVKNSTSIIKYHKGNQTTIDEYIGKQMVINETLGISEDVVSKLTDESKK